MSNKLVLTDDEIEKAKELLKKAGHPQQFSTLTEIQSQMYTSVLKAEEKMLEEIRQIYKQCQEREEQEYAEWKREDIKDDKQVARKIRASLGLED
ncbi:hypothetical protein [Nostoc foliaceum]|uniref:Uncharacterized protein n=1 Tax=Nostoc foliaceum FACHB-393 TaxID=2692915 RepID=A0ABR8ILS5_9NOSO|nr:hypothetical protein [Nostoc foliaceum]MBD2651797.1 hypothetical protein [Nostoc foliaceum FACHB-393]